MSAIALSVADARKAFGGLVAVNDLSFDVHDGELFGLIGPNGSGKTTMLNLISGALQPDAGEIRLFGAPIAGLPAHQIARHGVARTFQLVRMLPSMDAERNVMAGAMFGHQQCSEVRATAVARELLTLVGLRGREHVPVVAMTCMPGASCNATCTSLTTGMRALRAATSGGAVGGMLIATFTGFLLDTTGSYLPVFIMAGSAYLLALMLVHLLAPRLEPARID